MPRGKGGEAMGWAINKYRAVVHPSRRRFIIATDQRGPLRVEIPSHRHHGHLRLSRQGFKVDVVGEVPFQQLWEDGAAVVAWRQNVNVAIHMSTR